MLVLLVEAELGLDGGTVDAESVKTLSCSASQFHVLLATMGVDGERNLEMHAGNELGIRELPDVDVMASDDTGECLDILSDFLNADILRSSLEKNACGGEGQGDRGLENNHGDEQRDGRIGIELSRPVSEPDDESRDHDANVSESVADDVQNHGIHTHIAVTVTVASLLSGLLWQSVVVTIVNAGIPSTLVRVGMLVVVKCTVTRLRAVEKRSVFVEVVVSIDG